MPHSSRMHLLVNVLLISVSLYTSSSAVASSSKDPGTGRLRKYEIPAIFRAPEDGIVPRILTSMQPKISKQTQKIAEGILSGYEDLSLSFKRTEKTHQTYPSISPNCSYDLARLRNDTEHRETYALQMLDAAGKPGSGILHGKIMWLGAYDECLKTVAPSSKNAPGFKGKYCVLYFPQLKIYQTAAGLITSLCVPDTCSSIDIDIYVYPYLIKYNLTAFAICPAETDKSTLSGGAIACIVLLGILGSLILVGTLLDVYLSMASSCHTMNTTVDSSFCEVNERTGLLSEASAHGDLYQSNVSSQTLYSNRDHIKVSGSNDAKQRCQFLLSFSVISNTKKLLSTSTASGQLTSVNGMRVLSMWWVILGHTFVFTATFLDNAVDASVIGKRWTFQPIFQGTFSVDTFFFMSGLLVAYLTLKNMQTNCGKMRFWFLFYFHRFWRLTPTYGLFLMFWTTVYPYLIKGPLRSFITAGENNLFEICKKKWWTNMLYINNFYPDMGDVNTQCMGWSWYLANDMQFFIISPFILILLHRYKVIGILATSFLIIGCVISRIVTAVYYRELLPNSQHPTRHTDEFYGQGSRPLYDKPYTRIAPYLVGILLGYILLKVDIEKVRSKIARTVVMASGWCFAWVLGLSLTYGLYEYYQVPPKQSSLFTSVLYISLSRFLWAVACAWVIFACCTGYGGLINKILSWSFWAPVGRLTYCAYLVHPAVLMYNIYNWQAPFHYTDMNVIYLFLGNLILSYMAAYVLSIAVEAPLLGLEKILLKRQR